MKQQLVELTAAYHDLERDNFLLDEQLGLYGELIKTARLAVKAAGGLREEVAAAVAEVADKQGRVLGANKSQEILIESLGARLSDMEAGVCDLIDRLEGEAHDIGVSWLISVGLA